LYWRHLQLPLSWLQYSQWVVLAILGLAALAAFLWCGRRTIYSKWATAQNRFRLLQQSRLSVHRLCTSALFFIAMNLLGGWITVMLVDSVAGDASVPTFAVLTACSAAWTFGFFAFLSPGGLLVREAALATMLLPWLPYSDGLTLAVLSRMAQLLAEWITLLAVIPRTGLFGDFSASILNHPPPGG